MKLGATGALGCILLASGCFIAGLVPDNPIPYLTLLGWAPVFVLILHGRSIRQVLFSSVAINFIVGVYGLSWLIYFGDAFLLPAMGMTIWIIPVFTTVCFLYKKHLPPPWLAAAPLIWACFWAIYSNFAGHLPAGDSIYQAFFSFPDPILRTIRFIPYVILQGCWVGLTAGLLLAASEPRKRIFLLQAGLFMILFGALFLLSGRISAAFHLPSKPLNVSVLQHDLSYADREKNPLPHFEQIVNESLKQNPESDLLVFPLYSLPQEMEPELFKNDGFFKLLAQRTGKHVLVGARITGRYIKFIKLATYRFYVGAFLYSPDGKLEDFTFSVDKSPFHSASQMLYPKFSVLNSSLGKIGVLISYESKKPEWAKLAKKQGADFLIGLSNPADFSQSALPYRELYEDRLRAIENGLFFLRSTPNGFSALIDPQGNVLKRSQLRHREILNFMNMFAQRHDS